MLQIIFGGVLAFSILDRVTGQWSVANSSWFNSFYQTAIQNTPLLWFILSLFVWLIVGAIFSHVTRRNHFKKQGTDPVIAIPVFCISIIKNLKNLFLPKNTNYIHPFVICHNTLYPLYSIITTSSQQVSPLYESKSIVEFLWTNYKNFCPRKYTATKNVNLKQSTIWSASHT